MNWVWMEEMRKNWSVGTGWWEGREGGYKTFLGWRIKHSRATAAQIGGTGCPSQPPAIPGRVNSLFRPCSALSLLVHTSLDHGHDHDGEFERGIERVPVVTRYLLPAVCTPAYLTSILRVGRVRCQVGTHRFHRPPPVRHFRTALTRLRSIV